jgi:DNA-binding CsgD family transcriptional regulator
LTANERSVLAGLREGKRQAQIARDMGLSRERVGQIKRQLQIKDIDTRKVEESGSTGSDGGTDGGDAG